MVAELAGRRVLVTGGSSGIGAASAVAFARAGARVAICARRGDRLTEVLAACREYAPNSAAFTTDLSRPDEVQALAASVTAEFGGVDVLVNNAGIPKRRRAVRLSADDVREAMAVNFDAPVALTGALLPGMLERGDGDVVNLSSMGVHMFAMGVGAYAASKAALELWTEALYLETAGSGVRVHLFVPGTTLSEFSTPREGNDPPFPVDPASAATPQEVASALLECLRGEDFVTYATARDAASAAAKNADPNGFLRSFLESTRQR